MVQPNGSVKAVGAVPPGLEPLDPLVSQLMGKAVAEAKTGVSTTEIDTTEEWSLRSVRLALCAWVTWSSLLQAQWSVVPSELEQLGEASFSDPRLKTLTREQLLIVGERLCELKF